MTEEAAVPNSPDTISHERTAEPQTRGCEGRRRTSAREASWSPAEGGVLEGRGSRPHSRRCSEAQLGRLVTKKKRHRFYTLLVVLGGLEMTITNYYHKGLPPGKSGGEGNTSDSMFGILLCTVAETIRRQCG